MTVEFFYDCSSPFTYLGFVNMRALADELGIAVIWRPILVGGVFNAVNPSVYDQRAAPVPAKAAYHQKDIQDWARLLGLTIKFPPSVFPANSVKAMRGCLFLKPQGKELAFAGACFKAHWSDDLDIGKDDVLADICGQVGVAPDVFFRGIAEASIKDQLRANTDELIQRGGFGSPTVFVDGDDMYFGNDRICLVREALLRKRRSTP
jgi:2-hydroxychromene-2-carboxylate isomerase